MSKDLENKVADFIAAEGLLTPADTVLLAVSGGADSTALMHVMSELKNRHLLPTQIVCAHINHQLRADESQRDQDFVIEQCGKLHLPVVTKQIDVRGYARSEKLSIETAARNLRIKSLLDIAKERNCACVATAHHKNDNAETIIHRLSRGTGFRGLCGIWPMKKFTQGVRFVRPLLCVSRPQIIDYLKRRGLKWCQDRTNLDCCYRRNFIRNRLVPALQKSFKGDIVEQLAELSKSARGFYRLVCDRADSAWQDIASVEKQAVTLNLNVLSAQPEEVKVEIIRRALIHFNAGEQDLTQQHYENILRLKDGVKLQLPGRLIAHRQGTKIIFERSRKEEVVEIRSIKSVVLKVPGITEFAGMRIDAEIFDYDSADFEKFRENKSNTVEWLDFDKLILPLEVRFRKRGDRFWPFSLAGEKRIGKFLTTAKVSATLKQKLFVIADAEKIIWLCPVRLSEKVKVTNQTKRILQLKVIK